MKKMKTTEDELSQIRAELAKFKDDGEKRKFLFRKMTDLTQRAIEAGDSNEGQDNPAFRWCLWECRYLNKVRQIDSAKKY
jgi:hypothetical protein